MKRLLRKIAPSSFLRRRVPRNILFVIHNRKQAEYVVPVMEYLKDKTTPFALFTSQSMVEPKAGYIIPDDENIGPLFERAGFPYREIPNYSFPEFKKILDEFSVDRVLLVQANTRPSCYIYRDIKSNALDIPIVSQQCSIITPEDLSWYGNTWCGDVVAAHSEHSKIEMVRRRGVDPSIIHVTGSPKYDSLTKTETESDGTILFIGQNNFNAGEQYPVASTLVTDLLCSLLLELPDEYRILIKEHPNTFFGGSFEEYLEESLGKSHYAHLRERISRVLVADTTELMRKASLVCTIYSNCGLEAMVMNKPTVILNIHPHAEALYGDSTIITDGIDDFVPMCLKALNGETEREVRDRFVSKMLLLDGRSSQRIGDLILKPRQSFGD